MRVTGTFMSVGQISYRLGPHRNANWEYNQQEPVTNWVAGSTSAVGSGVPSSSQGTRVKVRQEPAKRANRSA